MINSNNSLLVLVLVLVRVRVRVCVRVRAMGLGNGFGLIGQRRFEGALMHLRHLRGSQVAHRGRLRGRFAVIEQPACWAS